jgi:hypothetical protein
VSKPTGAIFSISTRTFETGPLARFGDVIGGNFAVRASIFEQGYRFDADIGPANKPYAMGSETEFLARLVKDGHRVWWLSDLVVEHVVRPEQFRRSWIWRRTVRYGRGTYRQDAYEHPEPPFLFGMPRYAIRQVASEGLRAVLAALAGRRKQCFEALWMIAFTWGQLVEGRRMRKENAPR